MASSYVAIEFRAPGPDAYARAVSTIDAVPRIELIFERSRELAWYERSELFGLELECRVVIWVHDALDATQVEGAEDRQDDPYRKLRVYDVEYEVPASLADEIDRLGGACSIVERGMLRFATRRYEERVRVQLAAELEAAAGKLARCEFGTERRSLIGRIEGAIPKIHELADRVRRSGLVDPARVFVDYL